MLHVLVWTWFNGNVIDSTFGKVEALVHCASIYLFADRIPEVQFSQSLQAECVLQLGLKQTDQSECMHFFSTSFLVGLTHKISVFSVVRWLHDNESL